MDYVCTCLCVKVIPLDVHLLWAVANVGKVRIRHGRSSPSQQEVVRKNIGGKEIEHSLYVSQNKDQGAHQRSY